MKVQLNSEGSKTEHRWDLVDEVVNTKVLFSGRRGYINIMLLCAAKNASMLSFDVHGTRKVPRSWRRFTPAGFQILVHI